MGVNVSRYVKVWERARLQAGVRRLYTVLHYTLSMSFFALQWLVDSEECKEAAEHEVEAGAPTEAPTLSPTAAPTALGFISPAGEPLEECFVQKGLSAQELMSIILPMLLVVWFLEHLLGASPAEHRVHKAKQEAEKAAGNEPNIAAVALIAEEEGGRLSNYLPRHQEMVEKGTTRSKGKNHYFLSHSLKKRHMSKKSKSSAVPPAAQKSTAASSKSMSTVPSQAPPVGSPRHVSMKPVTRNDVFVVSTAL
jgi:hypothetical protein